MNGTIKKIVLQLGSKEIELTPEEAKKLHEALGELFDKKVIVEERHVHHDYPWRWVYTQPSITVTPTYPYTTTPIWYQTTAGAQSWLSEDGVMSVNLLGQ